MSPPKFMLKLSNPSLCARCTVQFSRSVMSNSLQPHGLQQARLPCPSPTPGASSNSCPSRRWCHPTISSCHPLLLLPSIFPSTRVFSCVLAFRIRWREVIGASASASVLPRNIQGWFHLRIDWFDFLAFQGTLRSFLQHPMKVYWNILIISLLKVQAFMFFSSVGSFYKSCWDETQFYTHISK